MKVQSGASESSLLERSWRPLENILWWPWISTKWIYVCQLMAGRVNPPQALRQAVRRWPSPKSGFKLQQGRASPKSPLNFRSLKVFCETEPLAFHQLVVWALLKWKKLKNRTWCVESRSFQRYCSQWYCSRLYKFTHSGPVIYIFHICLITFNLLNNYQNKAARLDFLASVRSDSLQKLQIFVKQWISLKKRWRTDICTPSRNSTEGQTSD